MTLAQKFRNAKDRRRAAFTRLQRLYTKDRKSACTRVLDGTWDQEDAKVPLEDVEPFWRKLLTKESVVDHRTPTPVTERVEALDDWVTAPDIRKALRGAKGAAGPDGWRWEDVRKLDPGVLAQFLNLWLLLEVQPSTMVRGRTTLIPKEVGAVDLAKMRPITVTSVFIRLLHKILAKCLEPVLGIGEDSGRVTAWLIMCISFKASSRSQRLTNKILLGAWLM